MTRSWGNHGRHLGPIEEELSDIERDACREIRAWAYKTIEQRTMMKVTGRVGVGKTFAVARATEAVQNNCSEDVHVAWVELAGSTSPRRLLADLFPQLCQVQPPKNASAAELRTELSLELARRPCLVVLDEAQYVQKQSMTQLRWLHDRADANFGLIIVGTTELNSRIPPEIQSRCVYDVEVPGLEPDTIQLELTRLHPRFGDVSPNDLVALNRIYARGELRWWTKFLVHLVQRPPGPVSFDEAKAIASRLAASSQ